MNQLHQKINIIPSFHYDISYLRTDEEYLHYCINNIHQALAIMEQHEHYHFTLEQVYLVREYWNRHPENRDKIKRFVQEGRLSFAPGMYAMPDMNLPDGESFYMQIKLGKDWLQDKLNMMPKACLIADCWGHHAQLPQILTQAGYDYYIFWRCMRRDVMRNDFIWRGMDGTPIRTHWLAKGYGGVSFPDQAEKVNALDIDFAGSSMQDILELNAVIRQYGSDQPALIFNGGDFAYPQMSAPTIVDQYPQEEYEINFATLEKHLAQVDWRIVESFDGEFNTSQQGTFTTNIPIKQQNRSLVNQLHALERFAVLSRKDIDTTAMWEVLLKQQFHDIICGSICDGAVNDAYSEMKEAQKLIFAGFERVDSQNGVCGLFNPLDVKRNELVQLQGKTYRAIIPPHGGVSMDDVKAVEATTLDALPLVFENPFYHVEMDEKGYIIHLVDRSTGVDRVMRGDIPFGGISMQMDYGDVWLNFDGPISGGSMEASLTQNRRDPYYRGSKDDIVDRRTFPATIVSAQVIEQSKEHVVIRQESRLKFWKIHIPIVTMITLDQASPVIRYQTSFVPSGKNYRMRVAFPTRIEEGLIRHEIPYGIQVRDSAEYPCQNWCDYSDTDGGVALINQGIPANNVDEGIMMLTIFRSVAMEYKTDSMLSYNEGRPQCFEYGIMVHGSDQDEQIVHQARCFNQPVSLRCMDRQFIETEGVYTTNIDNVVVSGLRYSDNQIFVRLYEAIGREVPACRLSIPQHITSYQTANGLQEAQGEPIACDDSILLTLRPFEIRNIILRID